MYLQWKLGGNLDSPVLLEAHESLVLANLALLELP